MISVVLTILFVAHFRSIRRIIFYSVVKLQQNENGEKEISSLTVSQALQIAG